MKLLLCLLKNYSPESTANIIKFDFLVALNKNCRKIINHRL